MSIAQNRCVFDFLKTIQVQLPDEAGEFIVSKERRQDLFFKFFLIENVELPFIFIKLDNFLEFTILTEAGITLRIVLKFEMKLLVFVSYFMLTNLIDYNIQKEINLFRAFFTMKGLSILQ